jgi:hypothetical protein
LFATGNIVIDFQNGCGFALRITLQDPAAGDDDFSSVFSSVDDLAFPVAVALKGLLDLVKGLGELRLEKIVSQLSDSFVARPPVSDFGSMVPKRDSVLLDHEQ